MTYEVVVSSQAEQDIRGIYEYIAFALLAPKSAAGQIERLRAAINSLDTMPNRYRLFDDEPWRSRGLRIRAVDRYVVLYTTDEKRQMVNIVRVMYGGRNIEKWLNVN